MSNTISVVISTRKKDDNFYQHIKKALSHPKSEILLYENDGQFSLAEVYNKGLEESKNEIVLFMHDDIIIKTTNLTHKIIKLFEKFPDYGIIGVAGTTDLVNGKWWEIKKSMHGKVCLLYTSDAADDLLCVDLGGRSIIEKKKTKTTHQLPTVITV